MPSIEDRQEIMMITDYILKRYGKPSLNAGEFADYLGKTRDYVCEKIRRRELPGYVSGRAYCVPANAIAMWEWRLSKTRNLS